jgi:hypothetical protein
MTTRVRPVTGCRPTTRIWIAAVVASLVGVGCEDDPQRAAPVDPCTEQPCDVAAVVTQLGDAYRQRDYAHFARLLHDDFVFVLHPDPDPDPSRPPPPPAWGKTEELRIHRRMFVPDNIPAGEEPVDARIRLAAVDITLARGTEFVEQPDYYRSTTNPNGLDSARWKALGAECYANVLFDLEGNTDYLVSGTAWFVVAQDLTKASGDPAAFVLYRWQDLGGPAALAAGRVQQYWTQIKQLYRPRACAEPCEPEDTIARLSDAYAQRNYASYANLFHEDFIFILNPDATPDPNQPPPPTDWGKTEELRIHKRMFEPASLPPNEEPVPLELWLAQVTIALNAAGSFQEQPEYYRSATHPQGLDPGRWKAWGAEYQASVLFETQGATDYQVTGDAWFVVVDDLARPVGEAGKFTLYRWQDLAGLGAATAIEQKGWSTIKQLYR